MERRDVIRTRKSIKETYLLLSLKMPLNKITVSAIIDELQISRSTFYAYFQDIIELREKVEQDYIDNKLNLLEDMDFAKLSEDPYPVLIKGFQMFSDNAIYIRGLTNNGKDDSFFQKYKVVMNEKISQYIQLSQNDIQDSIVISCIASIYVDFCREIIYDDNKLIDLEKYAKIVSIYISSGIKGVHKKYWKMMMYFRVHLFVYVI